MQSTARTVDEYINSLPEDRKQAVARLRELIKEHLQPGFEEGMQYGMIGYYVPLAEFPDTYNGQPLSYIGLASQKNYMSLYLLQVYGNKDYETKFKAAYAKSGKKLDMGKSCLRFKKLEDLPLDVVAEAVDLMSAREFIDMYMRARS